MDRLRGRLPEGFKWSTPSGSRRTMPSQGALHSNELLIRNAFEAFMRGDLATARAFFDPNVSWHVSGRGPLSGDFRGFDEIAAWGARLVERFEGTFREELLDVVANESTAFQRVVYRGSRGVRSIEDLSVNVFRLERGKIVECWVLFADPYGFDAMVQ
jgi:uncharacterized protein